jgi:hypothetical protein
VKLLKEHRPWLRTRVVDHRIVYAVDGTARVVIGHRREVYRDLNARKAALPRGSALSRASSGDRA